MPFTFVETQLYFATVCIVPTIHVKIPSEVSWLLFFAYKAHHHSSQPPSSLSNQCWSIEISCFSFGVFSVPAPGCCEGWDGLWLPLLMLVNPSLLGFQWTHLRMGRCGLFFYTDQLSLHTPFYSVFVSISIFMALSTLFHSKHSPNNCPLSHSDLLLVLFPQYWSFQLYISYESLH